MSDERDERRDRDDVVGEPLDLQAWPAGEPPPDFAERVLARIRAEDAPGAGTREQSAAPDVARRRSRRWGMIAGGAVTLAIAAAVALRVGTAPAAEGEAVAHDRREVTIGGRARAVLEPGAKLTWRGDDVVQSTGDVFYRVEPGARFVVHTPAGDVEVKGTCFAVKVRANEEAMQRRDVKAGVVGAALSGLAFVAVYEGKVAVSHAGERADLGAGESAQLGSGGVTRSADADEGQKAFEASAAAQDDPLARANQSLVAQVGEYRARLEQIATNKADLEKKLEAAEAKLATGKDGKPPRARSEFDLDQEDWAELTKQGQVKYKTPCFHEEGWTFGADKLAKLGLAPGDGATLRDAYAKTHDHVWKELRPLCQATLGSSADVVDRIGPETCVHLIYNLHLKKDGDATNDAFTAVGEIRSGQRPEPGPNEKVHPVTKLFLLMTSANKSFEGELAKAFGPEEAHRLAYADGMCTSSSTWGGGKKR